jgi:hypothetical protein
VLAVAEEGDLAGPGMLERADLADRELLVPDDPPPRRDAISTSVNGPAAV